MHTLNKFYSIKFQGEIPGFYWIIALRFIYFAELSNKSIFVRIVYSLNYIHDCIDILSFRNMTIENFSSYLQNCFVKLKEKLLNIWFINQFLWNSFEFHEDITYYKVLSNICTTQKTPPNYSLLYLLYFGC